MLPSILQNPSQSQHRYTMMPRRLWQWCTTLRMPLATSPVVCATTPVRLTLDANPQAWQPHWPPSVQPGWAHGAAHCAVGALSPAKSKYHPTTGMEYMFPAIRCRSPLPLSCKLCCHVATWTPCSCRLQLLGQSAAQCSTTSCSVAAHKEQSCDVHGGHGAPNAGLGSEAPSPERNWQGMMAE